MACSGLPSSRVIWSAIRRSFSTTSAGTSSRITYSGRMAAVQVARHVSAVEPGEPAELQLLLQARACFLDELLDRGARPGLRGQQRQPVGDPGLAGRARDLGGHLLEQVGLGDEVGLAVQLDEHAGLGTVEFGRHQAVGRGAGGPLVHVLGALEPEQLDRGLQVAVRLAQRVLAVHHAGAALVAKPLHVSGGEIRHVLVSHSDTSSVPAAACPSWSPGALSLAASPAVAAVTSLAASAVTSFAVAAVTSFAVAAVTWFAASFAAAALFAASFAAAAWSSAASAMAVRSSAWSAAAAVSLRIADSALISRAAAPSAAAAATVAVSAEPAWEPTSSSRSHSASGSSVPIWLPDGFSSPEAAPARAIRPSATASATTRVSSATLRIASSLPGIG